MLAVAVVFYFLQRPGERPAPSAEEGGRPSTASRSVQIALGLVAAVLGALLFAASLAEGSADGWPGLPAGAACAAVAFVAVGSLMRRAGRRLEGAAAGFLPVYADGLALALAALAILAPPVGFLALGACLFLMGAGRRQGTRKYEGLRILR